MAATQRKQNNNGARGRQGMRRRARQTAATPIGAALDTGRSELHEAGISTFPVFEMMVNPEDNMPMRIPDGHAGTTAVFKSPLVVDLPYSGVWNPTTSSTPVIDDDEPVNGYSEVILGPGTTGSIYHTLGHGAQYWEAGTVTATCVPVLATHPELPDVIGGNTQLVQGLRLHDEPAPLLGIACLPKLNSDGHAVFELRFTPDDILADYQISFSLSNIGDAVRSSTEVNMHVWFADGVTEIDIDAGTVFSGTIADLTVPVVPSGTTNGTINRFYIEVSDTDPASHWVFGINSSGANALGSDYTLSVADNKATAFRVLDLPELNKLAETQSERTTALSGLITYMGSTLQDGGRIAAARLGMGLSPLRAAGGDTYSNLASLPFYNDDFALRDGAYCWWLPDSIQEHFYVPFRFSRLATIEFNSILQFAMHRDQPAQGVRLRAVQCIEVITRSRLYASDTSTVNPSYEMMISVMKGMPAVTINSRHKGILSRAFASIKKWVSKPDNWLRLFKFGRKAVKLIAGA